MGDCGSRWVVVGSGREGGEGGWWWGMVGLLVGFCPAQGSPCCVETPWGGKETLTQSDASRDAHT